MTGRAGRVRCGRRRTRLVGDAGITMMDVVVSMTLMAIFMAMFTRGTVQMFHSATQNQAVSNAQNQITTAFLRLDKEIRYAAGISIPGQVGTDWYVEYLTTNTGTPMCAELRLNVAEGQLQRRSWQQGSVPLAPSAWVPLASSVSGTSPFTYAAPDATYNFQRLELQLAATVDVGGGTVSKRTDVMFTALNTTVTTTSATVCTEGRTVS